MDAPNANFMYAQPNNQASSVIISKEHPNPGDSQVLLSKENSNIEQAMDLGNPLDQLYDFTPINSGDPVSLQNVLDNLKGRDTPQSNL